MLVQVIPYVADQFEPGVYVFEGESLSSSLLLESTSTKVFSTDTTTYNTYSILEKLDDVGIFATRLNTFNRNTFLSSVSVVIIDGAQVDFTYTISNQVYGFYVGNNDIDLKPYVESSHQDQYTRSIEGEIQNNVGKPKIGLTYFGSIENILDVSCGIDQVPQTFSAPAKASSFLNLSTQDIVLSKAVDSDLALPLNSVTKGYMNVVSKEAESTPIKFNA